jgi:ZIP family zinc transporter
VLLFLVWDVLSHAWAPIDDALTSVHQGKGGLGVAVGYAVLFAAGLAVGLLTLVYYESWKAGRSSGALTSAAVPSPRDPGPWAPEGRGSSPEPDSPPGPPPDDSHC